MRLVDELTGEVVELTPHMVDWLRVAAALDEVGGDAIPATEYEVTEDQLEELTGPDLYALLAAKLEPHELPERNDEL